jgi:hypothetical protein
MKLIMSLSVVVVLCALAGCGGGGSFSQAGDSLATASPVRITSTASGTVTITAPSPGAVEHGNFTATVNTTLSGGMVPFVIYHLIDLNGVEIDDNGPSDGGQGVLSWDSPHFSATIIPPSGLANYYHLEADYYAYDSPNGTSPRLLDVKSELIEIID